MKQRTAARVLLVDQVGRILLVRFVFPQSAGALHFWATPGGGVEPGETPLQAATRELREELCIAPVLTGPVHHAGGVFEYEGELVDNRDAFYLARWSGRTPQLVGVTELERDAMREVRWWTLDELRSTSETVYPSGLGDLLARLLQPADQ